MDTRLRDQIFNEIYVACGYRFWKGCGSYLFEGQDYTYSSRMLDKQNLLFDAARTATRVLELGVYMGHSLLIMLLANPTLTITCVDIDDTYSAPSIEVLRRNFPDAKITFIKSPSIHALTTHIETDQSFDLIHIDSDHHSNVLEMEFQLALKRISSTSTVVFDDYDSFPITVDRLIVDCKKSFDVTNVRKANCVWRNLLMTVSKRTTSPSSEAV